jgi:hypothetical protein
MDVAVLSHRVLEADDDIARGANGSVGCAVLCGIVRAPNIIAAAHTRLLIVTLSARVGLIAGCTGD